MLNLKKNKIKVVKFRIMLLGGEAVVIYKRYAIVRHWRRGKQ
jgi:hypothetical protein